MNLEPAVTQFKDAELVRAEKQADIQKFLNLAQLNPDRTYYLVVDITVDLRWQAFSEDDASIPENVVIFETASISKHQDGGQNYFYGVITVWGFEKIQQFVQDHFPAAKAELGRMGIVHIPRLPTSERAWSRAENARKARVFSAELSACQSALPLEQRLVVEHYSYYSLINLPYPFFESVVSGTGILSDEIAEIIDKLEIDLESIRSHILSELRDSDKDIKKEIQFGDSFNLAQTRIGVMNTKTTKHPHYTDDGTLRTFRISWGRTTSDDVAQRLAHLIGTYYLEKMQKLTTVINPAKMES